MNKIFKALKEFSVPSKRVQVPHHRGATGAWHALLGAQVSLMFISMPVVLLSAVLLYILKEVRDISVGGSISDSIEDTAFVLGGMLIGFTTYPNLYTLIVVTILNSACFLVMLKETWDAEA